MPSHRKYSRSRSPDHRSNRYKRDREYSSRRRSRSPTSRRERDRSRSSHRRDDRRRREYDIDRERQRARERGLRESSDRKDRDRPSHRHQSVDRASSRDRTQGTPIREASSRAESRPAEESTSTSLKRKAESPPPKPRRSRFDQAAPVSAQPTPAAVSPQVAHGAATNVLTDAEKLRQRQERLAEWKRKKAEEAAKKATLGGTQSVPEVAKSTDQPDVRPSAKPSVALGKFGMAQTTKSAPRKHLVLDAEEDEMTTKQSRNLPLFTETDTATVEEEEEIDPLDAFMAKNSSELTKQSGAGPRTGDILNDSESDGGALSEDDDILAMVAKHAASKKKDLAGVDHAKQEYEDFRKDFYIEPEELRHLNDEEVDAMRLELDGIVIRGKDCPKPVSNWGQCGLSAATLDQIQRLGYDAPTSIQAQAIPAIMSGRDTIGVAKTGSGKTVAFLLPMFRHIKDQRPIESMEGPIAIILTPTRELAVQIHKECKPFLKALDLRAVCAYGGPPIKDQIAEFKRGAEIVVCTPGRMIDILAANQGRVTNLHRITYCVLDEADRMFDLGFEPQVMKILNNIRPQRQTVLFSATFPKSMEALARKILRGKPLEITVGARSVVAPEITQIVEVRPADDPTKFNRVLEILGNFYIEDEDALTLIFVDRQEAADSLLAQLMRKGYPCNALHGGKDQSDRDGTISDFKAGIFPVLVATSVAARGLDVKQLKLVINYDCPNHMEDYVHRVGRTGRAGNKGTAITFVGEDQERYAFEIAKALRLSQVDIPEPLKKLADSFAAKVKAGTEKGTASGFGGKGLAKFDTARDLEKKIQRKIYGDDEEDEEAIAKAKEMQQDDDNDRVNPEEAQAVLEGASSARTDAPIKVERVSASSTGKRSVGTKVLNPVAAARARIDAINNRIKVGGKAVDTVASNPDAGEYRAMMEINDYPQKARWNVTNRTNIAKILEATGTSITTQGQYIKPGTTIAAGTPKLYLLIEGPTEVCVTDAVKELRRLLSEGTMQDIEAGSSRYKVI